MPARKPARRPRGRRRPPGLPVVLAAVVLGAVAVLTGTGVAELNEPTAVPQVSANLVVLSHGELLGSRLVGVGAALLTLGAGLLVGLRLGARTSRPRRRRAG